MAKTKKAETKAPKANKAPKKSKLTQSFLATLSSSEIEAYKENPISVVLSFRNYIRDASDEEIAELL